MSTSTKYVVNGELTGQVHFTVDVMNKSSVDVTDASAVRVLKDSTRSKAAKNQCWQRFMETKYPDESKSSSVIVPGCIMYHEVSSYYDKPSIHVRVPQAWVAKFLLKLSTRGIGPKFAKKRILSDAKYWWTRASMVPAEENKEYIRVTNG